MRKKSEYRTIIRALKVNSNEGGFYLFKLIEYAIKNHIKPLDINMNELYSVISNAKFTDKKPKGVKTLVFRFMPIIRGNNKLVELFTTCKRLTVKKFIINMLLLYHSEVERGIIKATK